MATYDVLGIGNAIVDVLSFCSDETLARLSLQKGGMTLVDEIRAEALYREMGSATECSGGSVANSLAGLASLGAKCAYIGKVRADQLGEIFRHDMRGVGVHFDTPAATSGPATARCLIFVTPDAQRTMQTFLGACTEVSEADIDESLIASAKITYIEGYLWDQPNAKSAIRKALKAARNAGTKVAFTLSDTFCVERHRDEFAALIQDGVDILFANEQELLSLTQTPDFDAAVEAMRGRCPLVAVTRSEKGCVVLAGNAAPLHVATAPAKELVDTTGAGDLFASGFLFGLTRDWDMRACAELGNACAGRIIQQMGARSAKPLSNLIAA